MSERKWKVGGKYRLVDVEGFINCGATNKGIADKIGTGGFTVESLGDFGIGVKTLVEFPLGCLEWTYWFNPAEIKFFEEITAESSKQDNPAPKSEQDIVIDWLDKFTYVVETDSTVGSMLDINLRGQPLLETDHGNIIGSVSLAEFINNRYSQLIEQANAAKREKAIG